MSPSLFAIWRSVVSLLSPAAPVSTALGLGTDAPWMALALALRIWAVLRVQVVWRQSCGRAWWWLAPALATVLATSLLFSGTLDAATVPRGLPRLAWMVAEFGLGTAMGWIVALPGWAAWGAAGLNAERFRLVDGMAARRLLLLLPVAAGWSLGVHHLLIESLAGTFEAWPVGHVETWPVVASADALFERLPKLAAELSLLALTFATPVLLTEAVVRTTLNVAAAPDPRAWLNSEGLRLWWVSAMGLIALGSAWLAYPQSWGRALG